MFDIVAIGECLIDFVSINKERGFKYEGYPGGAPANVLVEAARLGLKTAFIGKVGNDAFGSFLKTTLNDCLIDTTSLVISDEFQTTLAFVSLSEDGDRSFSFYRNKTADVSLTEDEVNYELIKKSRIFHFGSVSLTDEPSRSTTLAAVRFAKANNVMISYDPNLREMLWSDLEEAKKMILTGMELADIVKISEDELLFLMGTENIEEAMRELYKKYSLRFLAVTMGPKGCYCQFQETIAYAPAYDVNCIDTTGAGDAFMGALLYQIIKNGMNLTICSIEKLMEIMNFSNAAGSLSTTKKGAIPAMPQLKEILECMKDVPYLKSE